MGGSIARPTRKDTAMTGPWASTKLHLTPSTARWPTKLRPSGRKINCRQNITESERMAIKELAKNNEITIKQADIGRAIVIMNTADYVKEAERQLSDEKTYKKLQDNPTKNYPYEINNIIDDMVINGDINENVAKILRNNETRTPQMYFLPKIHKGTLPPPGRPIVSANGCPTEKISAFVDHFLNPMVNEMNSYVEDTSDCLHKINGLKTIDKGSVIGTMDVSSLYTNIPNEEGITCIRRLLNKKRHSLEKTKKHTLVHLLDLVLITPSSMGPITYK